LDAAKINFPMSFSQIILENFGSTFRKYHLYVIDQEDNYLKVCSDNVMLTFVHNPRENSNTFWAGKNDNQTDKVEIDNNLLETFFSSQLKLSHTKINEFVTNLELFFRAEGKLLLIGSPTILNALEKFDLERSQRYTLNLLAKQDLQAADDAWNKSDYKKFIHIIEKINNDTLPKSYLLKYKIANEKLKH
jgi:hypothetical protein